MKRLILLSGLCAALLGAVWRDAAESQSRPAPPRRPLEQLRKMSIEAEVPGLADPFRGITTNGRIQPGLFSIRSTGVSTAPVRTAADAFLAALSPAQRAKTLKPVDDPEWRKWMNQSFYIRDGASFLEMTPAQREAAFALMRAGLSARGLKQTRDIMRLNETLAELNDNNFDELGEWQYFITVMGTPSAAEPWGWQFDGHHAVINYFVLGDQVVMSPIFAGSEPVSAASGKYKGTIVLQEEQNRGLAFVNSLTAAQRGKAILQSSKTQDLNLTEAWRDNVVLDYAGLKVSEMTGQQRAQLVDLIALYVGTMDDGHARVKMDEVRAHLDRTWFAWVGKTEPGSVFYYRIHSPVVLIEFDHQRPIGLRHLLDPNAATTQHIHTVVRTPNGNDYGKDLLRQHYERHPHPQAQTASTASTSIETRLRQFEDKAEIEQLLLDYGRHLDARDFGAYAALFAADGEWVGGFGKVAGPANIKTFMEKAMPGQNTARNYHLLSNFVISVQGDSATAWSRWAFVVPGQQGAAIAQAGRYDDTLVRENGRWRFKRRVASNDTAPPSAR